VVHVSIANWIKGEDAREKRLTTQRGDNRESPWESFVLPQINSALSTGVDVSMAATLKANENNKSVFAGQCHHSEGFLMEPDEAARFLRKHPDCRKVVVPYLTGEDLVEEYAPTRWIIDFGKRGLFEAMKFSAAFERAKEMVLPNVQRKADEEKATTGNEKGPRSQHLKTWWQFWRPRPELIGKLADIPRYIACSRVTKRPIFEFIESRIHPTCCLKSK